GARRRAGTRHSRSSRAGSSTLPVSPDETPPGLRWPGDLTRLWGRGMKRFVGVLGALSVASTAQAQPFAGLHYGQAEAKEVCRVMETPAAAMLAGNHCNDTDSAWGVSIGYRFNPNTALQVSFVDLGDVAAGALLT